MVIYEPIPWGVFERGLCPEPIELNDMVSILSKKQTIFIEDDHINRKILNRLTSLIELFPNLPIYLEYEAKTIKEFDLLEPKKTKLNSYKSRLFGLYKDNSLEGLSFRGREEEIIAFLKCNLDKKIIFLGKDHVRPGNGVHIFSPNLSNISVIYNTLSIDLDSEYNIIPYSKEINGFDIFAIKN